MEKKQFLSLIIKFRNKTITASELRVLKKEVLSERFEENFEKILQKLEESTLANISAERSERMFSQIISASQSGFRPKARKIIKKTWYIVGAAALLTLFFKLFLFPVSTPIPNKILAESNLFISPGSPKAIVLLEDGSSIDLEGLKMDTVLYLDGYSIRKDRNGELSYQLSAAIKKQEIVYNTIITPRGGEYKLNLPDGTKIWVNASSKLRYPLNFGESSRAVQLEGEAFFEVNKRRTEKDLLPFTVQSGSQKIEVLGTAFNVNSYTSEIQTTLVKGKVKLMFDENDTMYLDPNQQATYDTEKNLTSIKKVDPFYVIAWKSGSFAFDNAPLTLVMENLERWYDVSVEYDTVIKNIKFSGRISRYEQIEKVLSIIQKTNAIKFKIKGRRITVMK